MIEKGKVQKCAVCPGDTFKIIHVRERWIQMECETCGTQLRASAQKQEMEKLHDTGEETDVFRIEQRVDFVVKTHSPTWPYSMESLYTPYYDTLLKCTL